MQLKYHKDWRGNFGDDLNVPFFRSIVPGIEECPSERDLVGIGTLLNNVHGKIEKAVVFGSGFGYGASVEIDHETSIVLGVRGPLTARALGVDDALVMGDPALHLNQIPSVLKGHSLAPLGAIVVALHHRTAELWDFSSCTLESLYFLDPGTASIPDYIATVKGAKVVLAEAMHGAITACAFGVPFIPIEIFGNLHVPKWSDFLAALGAGMPATHRLPCPRLPLARRLQLSRVRPVFEVFSEVRRQGVPPSAQELDRLAQAVVRTSVEDPLRLHIRDFPVLVARFDRAVDQLRAYCRSR